MGTVWEIDFSVVVGENDISPWIISMEYRTSLCRPIGEMSIVIAPFIDYNINPYEDIVITIDGTKVFTGHTQSVIKARRPTTQTLECEDTLAKVRDTYSTDIALESTGQSIGYWVGQFLSMSNVNYSVGGTGPASPIRTWGIINAYDAILSLLKYTNWQINVDADGQINIQSHGIDEDNAIELNKILEYEHYTSDHWLRNRAVILGRTEEASVILDNYVAELEDETRAAIFASGDIIWPGSAYLMAWYMLNEFSTPWDVITVTIPGDINIRLGETVHITEDWESTDRYGLVTSWKWSLDAKNGYTCTITIDEKCPAFWLSDIEPTVLYCSTDGEGVWKTYNDGTNWFDISGEELTGQAAYVKDIHVVKGTSPTASDDIVWAATLGGIFKTDIGMNPWTNMTEEYMDITAQNIDWWGVLTNPIDSDKVYCLGNAVSGMIGDTTKYIIYMYISEDGGDTWTSYSVNPYDL